MKVSVTIRVEHAGLTALKEIDYDDALPALTSNVAAIADHLDMIVAHALKGYALVRRGSIERPALT